MITLFLFCLIIVSSCKNILTENNQTTTVSFREIDSKGLNPENIPTQKVIFRNQQSWEIFWEKYGKKVAPQIDFTEYIVVGVFLGPKPNPGYGVEITRIQKVDSQIVVKVVEYVENPNLGYADVIVYPYHIVSFPRTEGEIVFTVEQKFRDEE